jgi:type IV secretion system protein VirB5
MKTEVLTPNQVLLTDEIANEKYVGFYAERKMSRLVIAAGSVLLLGSFGVIVSLAHRPVQNRYIRIDEMGKATAIQNGDSVFRFGIFTAGGRGSHVPHRLGKLSLHHQ